MLSMFDKLFGKKTHGDPNAHKNYNYSSSSKPKLQEAQAYYVKMAQKFIVIAINSVDHTAVRVFILVSVNEDDSTIDIFFQMDGQLRMWNDLDNQTHKNIIS